MNDNILKTKGDVLVVSQFTLHASTKKGNRPSYSKAAKPTVAIPIYSEFVVAVERNLGKPIQTGTFGADMKVDILNDGPVTIIINTKHKV
jgi:D-tyrosyl-tRNA(Tyr) deacylase